MTKELELDVLVNQVAQNVRGIADLLVVFESLSEDDQRSVLRRVNTLAIQAGAKDEDVASALLHSGVRSTRTAAVLLAKSEIGLGLAKIAALPPKELSDVLRLTVSMFTVADQRRRLTKCANGCTHWWHRDLGDDLVLARIRRGEIGPG